MAESESTIERPCMTKNKVYVEDWESPLNTVLLSSYWYLEIVFTCLFLLHPSIYPTLFVWANITRVIATDWPIEGWKWLLYWLGILGQSEPIVCLLSAAVIGESVVGDVRQPSLDWDAIMAEAYVSQPLCQNNALIIWWSPGPMESEQRVMYRWRRRRK